MPASGVNHQVQFSILAPINFNEVVTAAKSPDAASCTLQVHMSRTAELIQINLVIK